MPIVWRIFGLACGLLLCSPASARFNDEAGVAFNSGKYDLAAFLYQRAAAEGEPNADYNFGIIRQAGLSDTKVATASAISFYTSKATQGDGAAMIALGRIYFQEEQYRFAEEWFTRATEYNMLEAFDLLRCTVIFGRPGAKGSVSAGIKAFNNGDYHLALTNWLPKARRGDTIAQNNMGVLYENGLTKCTPQNSLKAANWFAEAAHRGMIVAMSNLARVQLEMGHRKEALSWLTLASRWGDGAAINMLHQQGINPPPPDLALAQQESQNAVAANLGHAIGCALAGGCRSNATVSSKATMAQQMNVSPTLCPDGTYIASGYCQIAPDGSYVNGPAVIAPDGSYVSGTPTLAPNGKWVGGNGSTSICPDGSWVGGASCVIAPNGTWVGQ